MKKHLRSIFISIVLFVSIVDVIGQERGSVEQLKMIAEVSTHNNDVRSKYRKTEYFILFFEIDTIGKVSSIHMMSDESNRDSGYYAFKRLTAEVFKDWNGNDTYRNKIIVLPVFCMGIEISPSKESSYLQHSPYSPIYLPPGCTIPQQSKYILAPELVYFFPSTSTTHD